MADLILKPSLPFGLPAPGRHGARGGAAGVTARFRQDRAMMIVEAGRGARRAAAAALAGIVGAEAPGPGEAALLGEARLVAWNGPASWLVIEEPGAPVLARLAAELAGSAALIEQSDGRILVEIAGPKARETLAKGTAIDLHDRAFPVGATALSIVGHVNGQIVRIGAEAWLLIVPRSTAADTGHWLEVSAAAFGFEVLDPRG